MLKSPPLNPKIPLQKTPKSMVAEARKFDLRNLSQSSSQISSILYEPNSSSLALMHSDSNFSLYPSFSPFSNPNPNPNLPPPQTLIPGPNSSGCFVRINPNSKIQDCPDQSRVVFVTAGPYNGGLSRVRVRVLMRFFVLGEDGRFGKGDVVCSQNGVEFEKRLGGVIVDGNHGMKVLLCGSVNYFAMYSGSAGKVWIFGVKLGENGRDLRLVKCAVIDCKLPVLSVCISGGFLVLGELNGVRVFPLRALVKGRVGSSKRRDRVIKGKIENSNREEQDVSVRFEGRNLKLPNGVMKVCDDNNLGDVNQSMLMANGHACNLMDGVSSKSNGDGNHDVVKLRSLKLHQDSGEVVGMQFILFDDSVVEGIKSRVPGYKTRKAISIQGLSEQRFLILDSNGELHLLYKARSEGFEMRRLTGIIQVQKLAAFPDAQDIWISDGLFSLHKLALPADTDTLENENHRSCNEGNVIHSSVSEVIFASENIQDVIALAVNSVMFLGRDSLYAYAIS